MSMTVIAHAEVTGASSASIVFDSITGAAGEDLLLVLSLRGDAAQVFDQVRIKLNDSASNYTWRGLFGAGASVGSENETSDGGGSPTTSMKVGIGTGNSATSNTFCSGQVYFPNAFGSTAKSASADNVGENNATGAYQSIYANLWNDTSAISKIEIDQQVGTNWLQYSSATLYRVTAGSDGTTTVS